MFPNGQRKWLSAALAAALALTLLPAQGRSETFFFLKFVAETAKPQKPKPASTGCAHSACPGACSMPCCPFGALAAAVTPKPQTPETAPACSAPVCPATPCTPCCPFGSGTVRAASPCCPAQSGCLEIEIDLPCCPAIGVARPCCEGCEGCAKGCTAERAAKARHCEGCEGCTGCEGCATHTGRHNACEAALIEHAAELRRLCAEQEQMIRQMHTTLHEMRCEMMALRFEMHMQRHMPVNHPMPHATPERLPMPTSFEFQIMPQMPQNCVPPSPPSMPTESPVKVLQTPQTPQAWYVPSPY